MKKFCFIFSALAVCMNCSSTRKTSNPFDYMDASLPVDQRVELLLKQMTLEEKIGQMCQYVGEPAEVSGGNEDEKVGYALAMEDKAALIRKGWVGSFLKVPGYKEADFLQKEAAASRLKIPLLIATDAIHGHGMDLDAATIFPTPIGMASAFDVELVEQIASYTAKELRATGFHWSFSPNLDICRDPRWGRTGETFGEDTYLVSTLGSAMVKGYQEKDFSGDTNVIACAKHMVAGGIADNGLNGAPADVSERTLYEVFYPPFLKAIESKVYTIMPSHNEVNGIPCHADEAMLTTLLKKQWGFSGFVISDWQDIARLHSVHKIASTRKEADKLAVLAGLDMHMHGGEFLENIKALVEEGKISEERINDAVRKILYAKFQLGLFEKRYSDEKIIKKIVLNEEHKKCALEAARKSIVLLNNKNNLLPLSQNPGTIFITGPNANDQSILGDWSRLQPDSNVVTVLEGIQKSILSSVKLDYFDCGGITQMKESDIQEAAVRGKKADVCVVVVGENSIRQNPERTSGENLDRASLDLQGKQMALIKAMVRTGKPVIVVMINGAPICSEFLKDSVDALIEAWEPGMLGGQAVADVLFGNYNPSGKLPITFPRSAGHVRSFYNHKPSAYHRGKFKFSSFSPLYEFGYGLSYTTFTYNKIIIPDTVVIGEEIPVKVELENTGRYAGEEIVLLFIRDVYSSVTRPVKELKAFQRIFLKPGEKKLVEFNLSPDDLSFYNFKMKKVVEPGEFKVIVGLDKVSESFWVK